MVAIAFDAAVDGGGIGNGAARALLLATPNASLFTKLFSNDMGVVATDIAEWSVLVLDGAIGRDGGATIDCVPRPIDNDDVDDDVALLASCDGGGLEIRGGTGGDVSGGLSKLIELHGDSNDCSLASSASSNKQRVPVGMLRNGFSFGVLIRDPLRWGRTGW